MKIDKIAVIDISPKIQESSPVFPGDVQFSRNISLDFGAGDHLALSSLSMTAHIGSHADAPNHYHSQGDSIDQRSLHYYLGRCQVIDLAHSQPRLITWSDIATLELTCPRVLFRTTTFAHGGPWHSDFSAISPELIGKLAKTGVITIGIDTPSIDPAESKLLAAHQAIYANDLAILEGLNLDSVAAGTYQLIALPLKITGCDASPVRAVLIPD